MQSDFTKLIDWSSQFSYLPWRQNRSLYATLVSEIMLQQTTVNTVINKFDKFINQYPTVEELARASEEEVLIAWKGLGYYRRAKNLLKAAKFIEQHYAGQIPLDYKKLIAIPGIGDYTASAVLAIGNDLPVLAVDTNLERVLARYYGVDLEKGEKLRKGILDLFNNKKILNNAKLSFRALNEALMDLGREYCLTTKANCNSCPLQNNCISKESPLLRPVIKKKVRVSYDLSLLRILMIDDNKVWSYQKKEDEWLAGQWECPTYIVKSDKDLSQYPFISYDYKKLKVFKTNITQYKIANYILLLSHTEFKRLFKWDRKLKPILIENNSNFSTATHKALKLVYTQ